MREREREGTNDTWACSAERIQYKNQKPQRDWIHFCTMTERKDIDTGIAVGREEGLDRVGG